MKAKLTLLILLLGMSISLKAQEKHVYNITAASYLNENKEWTEFKNITGYLTIQGEKISVSVPDMKFNVSWELEVKGRGILENGDPVLVMLPIDTKDESLLSLIYCKHQDIIIYRIATPTASIQFVISKSKITYKSNTNLL